MIKKEDFPYDPKHVAIPLEKAIGLEIQCEDGEIRKVESIVHCAGSFQYAVINENLEGDREGHLIHLLKLFCILRGVGSPTPEEIAQFDEIAKSFTYEYVGKKEEFKRVKAKAGSQKKTINFLN